MSGRVFGRIAWIAVVGLSIAACGASELGEECDDAGSSDDCVDGAICTNEEDGSAVCRALCSEQEDCKSGEACNGVSGSNQKSCQPDKP